MIGLLSALIIIASILLVVVVFVQNPKGGGLSSDFGSAQQLGGVQRTSDFIEKATWTLAGVIAVCAIIMTSFSTPDTPKEVKKDAKDQQSGTKPPVAPLPQ